jgi:predicted phage tail component-like protein
MSNFIFKDICSDDMGIIVENLPPIVKPPKRYNLTEPEGSEKAIVETLGYKSYEKTIPVGFKNADLGQIMDWLEGAGKLVLSNEHDKYYDAFILNQIDYERIIRYHKANITFLVQPYKHATGEEETTARQVVNQGNTDCYPLMTVTGSGYIIVNINNVEVCRISNINGFITLDGEEQEARKGDTLQNRVMSGKFPVLSPGINSLSFSGPGVVAEVKTIVRSRWL